MKFEELNAFVTELNDKAYEMLQGAEFEGKQVIFVDGQDDVKLDEFDKFLSGFWIDNAVDLDDDTKEMIITNNALGLKQLVNSLEGNLIYLHKGTFDIDSHDDELETFDINMSIFVQQVVVGVDLANQDDKDLN